MPVRSRSQPKLSPAKKPKERMANDQERDIIVKKKEQHDNNDL